MMFRVYFIHLNVGLTYLRDQAACEHSSGIMAPPDIANDPCKRTK